MAQMKAFLVAWKWYLLGAAAVILVGGGVFWSLSGSDAATVAEDTKPQVKVGRVADLQGGNSLSVVAEIRSVNEAKISAESGGRVTRVAASLGDFVTAGKILAEVENGSQRAALLQAEGALEAAKAAVPNTENSLDAAKGAAVNTLLSAYASIESAVHDTIDDTYSNPESNGRKFLVLTSDSQAKLTLENDRGQLSTIVAREGAQAGISKNADLATELAKTESELRAVRAFLDTLIKALNAGIPAPEMSQAMITGHIAAATAARTSVTSSLSAITAAQSSLEIASNNSGDSGGLSASGASLKQAQGAYNAALAALEKTIIRSPISGSLNNFTIKLGDFLAPSQQVAVVSNNGALEAIAYVTEEDKSRVAVGQKVALDGGIAGTITKVAPALDPVTRRIEVRIGLPANATKALTNGQSVRVELAEGASAAPTSGPLAIPITALKIEANRTIVFVVENGRLAAKEITIGKLSGGSVQVSEGLSADTEIVADARGLKDGEEVTVAR